MGGPMGSILFSVAQDDINAREELVTTQTQTFYNKYSHKASPAPTKTFIYTQNFITN